MFAPRKSNRLSKLSSRLLVTPLESRDVPTYWSVTVLNPEGTLGSTAATHAGSLHAPTSPVEAGNEYEAIRRAVTGTETVTLDGETWSYLFNYANSEENGNSPYRVGVTGQQGVIFLEDLAGREGVDWDYDDHYWDVDVHESVLTTSSTGSGGEAGSTGSGTGTGGTGTGTGGTGTGGTGGGSTGGGSTGGGNGGSAGDGGTAGGTGTGGTGTGGTGGGSTGGGSTGGGNGGSAGDGGTAGGTGTGGTGTGGTGGGSTGGTGGGGTGGTSSGGGSSTGGNGGSGTGNGSGTTSGSGSGSSGSGSGAGGGGSSTGSGSGSGSGSGGGGSGTGGGAGSTSGSGSGTGGGSGSGTSTGGSGSSSGGSSGGSGGGGSGSGTSPDGPVTGGPTSPPPGPPPPTVGSIGDFTWHDLNGDGWQDADEPGLQGIQVELYAAPSGYLGDRLQTTTSDQSGRYQFNNVTAGQYMIRFVIPAGTPVVYTSAHNSALTTGDSDVYYTDPNPAYSARYGFTEAFGVAAGQANDAIDAGFVWSGVGRVHTVSYGGAGNFTISSDPTTEPYVVGPQWIDTNASRETPVGYVRDSQPVLSAQFQISTSQSYLIGDHNALIKAEGPDGISVSPTLGRRSGNLLVLDPTPVTGRLVNAVNHYDQFALNWSISVDGGYTWESAGQSANELCVTLAHPLDPDDMYYTLTRATTIFATGMTTEDDAIAAVWKRFSGRELDDTKGNKLYYYKDWTGSDTVASKGDIKGLIDSKSGTCLAMTKFFLDLLIDNGVQKAFTKGNYLVISSKVEGSLLYKNWDFIGNGTSGDAKNPYKNTLKDPEKFKYIDEAKQQYYWGDTVEVVDKEGIPGQNNKNPPSLFTTHVIASVGGIIYDASYGNKFDNLTDWEAGSLAGFAVAGAVEVGGKAQYFWTFRKNAEGLETEASQTLKYSGDKFYNDQ